MLVVEIICDTCLLSCYVMNVNDVTVAVVTVVVRVLIIQLRGCCLIAQIQLMLLVSTIDVW